MRLMKLKYLICNHKNKLTYNEVKEYVNHLKIVDTSKVNFIICPSNVYIYNFVDYTLGAQDVSAFEDTITGEITAKQLKSLRVKYVIIGHSERREFLNESYEILINKIKNANQNNLKVIYCIYEEVKDLDSTKQKVKEELEKIKPYLNNDAIIAYEPTWAIGKDINLDYVYINEMIDYIKNIINNDLIYGGNVNDKNIFEFLKNDKINGFLISNSSLNINTLRKILYEMS